MTPPREDIEKLVAYLRAEHEDEAADLVNSLLARAEAADENLDAYFSKLEALQESHTCIEDQRDAALARVKTLEKALELIADEGNWSNETGDWGEDSYPDEIARAALAK